mgnify:FL=1|jgi:hypothetical protein|tara:strand:+ start:4378 stop:4860 length:483 start_codon:yes stop_codon:yes gene_type:complete
MKDTKKACMVCGVELIVFDNWYPSRMKIKEYNCIPCHDIKRLERKIKEKGITPARIAKLFQMKHKNDYNRIKKGYIYVINNPSWEGWIKVGMAVDAENRCKQFQTSSPFRDYKLFYKKYFEDRKTAEKEIHKKLKNISKQSEGEWFKVSGKEAENLIKAI